MGLIDAEKLKARARHIFKSNTGGSYPPILDVNDIDRMPTIDPVHYAGGAYCRECCYGLPYEGKITCTEWRGMLHEPDAFCSYGRRREGADG